MMQWQKISLLLCTFGFFREFRPSESFITEYLSGHWRNLTSEQINNQVFPIGTYSSLTLVIIVFLVTDLLRYKPVIIFSSLAGIGSILILLWTRTLLELQIGQFVFGIFMATKVAYYTYMYAKVDRSHYQRVTGQARAAILCGKFLGGVLAQVLVSTDSMDFQELLYISLGTQILSMVFALLLPSVPRSLYFYSSDSVDQGIVTSYGTIIPAKEEAPKFSFKNATRLLWSHLVSSYTNPIVLQWSIWWALATCGQFQVITYIQFLWKEVSPHNLSTYNGGAEALAALFGAAGAMAAGQLNSNNRRTSYMIINSVCAAVVGAILIVAATTTNVWVAYAIYVIFTAMVYFMITVGAAIVAANLVDDSFGLVFGINTFAALSLQTILTVVAVTEAGFGLSPRKQYMVYGSYFIGLAALSLIVLGGIKLCSRKNKRAISN